MSQEHTIPEHSILSPSSAKAWCDCTASIYLNYIFEEAWKTLNPPEGAPLDEHAVGMKQGRIWEKMKAWFASQDRIEFWKAVGRYIPDNTSVYAQEGTMAHEYAERLLRGQITKKDIPEEFQCVTEYTDTCRALLNRWGGAMIVETRMPLFYYPKERGTCDNAIFGGDRICITDYKHGVGITVDADENPQLTAYALSLIEYFKEVIEPQDDTQVDVRIIQPRCRSGETEKVWETTYGRLKELGRPIQETADIILAVVYGGADPATLRFSPSYETCRFCKVKDVCPARTASLVEPLVDIEFDRVDNLEEVFGSVDKPMPLLDIELITAEQMLAIHRHGKAIIKLVQGVSKKLTEIAVTGTPVPGTKIVAGRRQNKKWHEPELAVEKLRALLTDEQMHAKPKLLSPTQLISLIEAGDIRREMSKDELKAIAKEFKAMTYNPEGRPALVMEDDPRPALTSSADLFLTIQDSEEYED